MRKQRTSILIIAIIVIILAAALLTVVGLYAMGLLVTDPIALTFAVQDASKTYDGTPLTASSYELVSGELLEGHTATVSFMGEQTDSGKGESDLNVQITDKKGYDVTKEYAVKVQKGELSVLPSQITVELQDTQVVYNGKSVEFDHYTVTQGKLVKGHKIKGSVSGAGLLSVGDRLPQNLKPVIYDANERDVSENYEVTFVMGDIQVVPRPVTLKPVDIQKTYDGIAVVADKFEIVSGSLAENQWAEVVINEGDNTVRDAGSLETYISEIAIYATDGNEKIDVSANYEIDLSETGTVEITPRELIVAAKSGSWTYDGNPHSLADDGLPESITGLAQTDRLLGVAYSGEITNVGTADNVITQLNLNTKTENYNITYLPGKLEIKPFAVTVIPKTFTKEYDGEPLLNTVGGEQIFSLSPALPQGFTLSADTDIGNLVNFVNKSYTLENVAVKNAEGTDCSANFIITRLDGQVSISRRDVTVSTRTESREYNGEELGGGAPVLTNGVSGHSAVATGTVPSLTDVGSVSNRFDCAIVDESGKDVTFNYRITYSYGTLTVTKKPVSLNMKKDLAKTFNGLAQKPAVNEALDSEDLAGTGLSFGDFEIVMYSEAKYVGSYAYSASLKPTASPKNYDLTINSGLLTITQASIQLRYLGGNITKPYDGTPVEVDCNSIAVATSAEGTYTVSSVSYEKVIAVGTKQLQLTDARIKDIATGKDVTENFEVSAGSNLTVPSVTVTERDLYMQLSNYTYQGTDYPSSIDYYALWQCVSVADGCLAEGDYLDFDDVYVSYDAEDHTIRITDFVIRNKSGADVTNCYEWMNDYLTANVILVKSEI